jgi:hypothetical protein
MTKTSKNTRSVPSSVSKPSKTRVSNAKPTASSDSEVAPTAGAPKAPSKQQQLAALLVRDEGATLDQMITVTGWLPHTTRAALTGLKKKGYAISSDKIDGVRTYRAVAPE